MRTGILAVLLCLAFAGPGRSADWTTPAELSDFRTTPGTADTLAYLKRLEQAAPGKMRLALLELWCCQEMHISIRCIHVLRSQSSPRQTFAQLC